MKGSLLIGLFLFLLLLKCCFCDYTESFITPSKVPQTFSPDSLDELNNWAKLVYTENYEPTLKPDPPNSFDWYMNNNASAYAVISADKPDTFGYRVGNFGFNLPVVSDSSLNIQEINLYSTRDAIQKTGSDALDMQYLFDVSLDFIFVYNSTVTTIEVIENDQVNGTKKMRSWEDPNDSSIVETLRIYGGGMEEFENTLNTRMINDNNFFVRSFTEIRNPLDSDPVDWPNYSFNAVLGNLNTTIKYEWTIQAWGISHEIGGADDLIQVFLHEGSVAENGGYDGIDCFWMCKIGENIFKSTQVNVNDSWIGCQAPSLQIGKSYSVDVSYINNANQNQFTNSGLNFFYSVCDCDDECINGECHNNICECDKGWNGTYCSEDICPGNNCSGNGDCNKNNGKCDCDDGYSGEDCSINLCEVEYDNCSNHGECSYHKEKGSCICDTQNGWEGDKCSEQICDTKDCGQFSTPNQGECLINGTCLCNYGYSGEKCQTDDCESMDCIHGVCDLEQNKCECESGYEGEYCNEKTSADSWSEKMSVKFDLSDLLVTNLDFVESLLHSEENQVFDYLIRSILYIFESQGEGANLLKHFIVKEINECNDPTFLFKGYSIATRLWTSFAHLPVGINYLHQTLSQPIYDLITEMSISEIEINPNKLNEKDSISSNKYNLMAAVETILSSIEKNSDQIPEQFCFILDTLSKALKLKWPEQILPQIGSFIISMLFNPVITSLNDYGLIEEPPEDSIIRIFILIAKVLTQLSNCSVFDEKDDYLTEMNEYLTNNHERMSKFLSQISTPLIEFEENALFPPSPLPKNIFEVSCANVHRFLLLNENKILNNLEQICENQDRYQLLKKEMQELIFLIGEPIPLQTLEDV